MKECEEPRHLSCPDRSGKFCKDVEWAVRFYDAKFQAMERAVDLASQLMRERMDGFPDQFVKKGDTFEEFGRIRADLNILMSFMNRSEGLASSKSVDTVRWIAVGGIVVGILGLVLRFFHI